MPKFEFEVNFRVQSYASLTRQDPAYLQITYGYVYYLRYTELKSFFRHRVWAPKPVYWPLNPSGYVYVLKLIKQCELFKPDELKIENKCSTRLTIKLFHLYCNIYDFCFSIQQPPLSLK